MQEARGIRQPFPPDPYLVRRGGLVPIEGSRRVRSDDSPKKDYAILGPEYLPQSGFDSIQAPQQLLDPYRGLQRNQFDHGEFEVKPRLGNRIDGHFVVGDDLNHHQEVLLAESLRARHGSGLFGIR